MSTPGRDPTGPPAPPEMLLDFLSLHTPKTPPRPGWGHAKPALGTCPGSKGLTHRTK